MRLLTPPSGQRCEFAQWCRITGTLTIPHSLGQRRSCDCSKGGCSIWSGWLDSDSDSLSAILENNTLFIEPYVSNPNKPVTVKQTDRFCFYSSTNYHLLSCQPFSIPCFHHLMPLAHVYCSDALPSAHATFYDISVPLTTNYEDTSRCFNIRQIQGHPGRCHSRPGGNPKGGGKDRTRGGWRSESCWKWVYAREDWPSRRFGAGQYLFTFMRLRELSIWTDCFTYSASCIGHGWVIKPNRRGRC